MRSSIALRAAYLALSSAALFACTSGYSGSGTPSCVSNADCPSGLCVLGECFASDGGADANMAAHDGGSLPCELECGASCCRAGERCVAGGCVIDLGPCETNDDCAGDSYCDATGRCTPYERPPDVDRDPSCVRHIEVGSFAPEVQCRWEGLGSAGLSEWNRVYTTPLVADFDLDDDPTVIAPTIVFASFATAQGGALLRLLDGRSCTEAVGSSPDLLGYSTQLAIADLDGHVGGRPEILALALNAPLGSAGLIAFEHVPETGRFERRWYGRRCDLPGEPRDLPAAWNGADGPSVHDLNDDGVPEVILNGLVYDAAGCRLNPDQAYAYYLGSGPYSVVTDVDGDPAPELVSYDGVYEWDDSAHTWRLESYFAPLARELADATRMGYVAVADFGAYACPDPDLACPEIVVVSAPSPTADPYASGSVRVMSIAGRLIFGPVPLPAEPGQSAGRGGPPTVGDFDGDGHREIGVAGASRYTVFDLDCNVDAETSSGCARAAGLPRGVLWSRPSQDQSSNVTGSSVFDFDADGRAEVVYADECYVRIYRGADGTVLFSSPAPSGTGLEYPIVADVDGDYNSEIVVALAGAPPWGCPGTDPLVEDGSILFEERVGILVLRDETDGWAASRSIWNQHAYAVTHIRDDGTVPRTSEWVPNHTVPLLNNFRMNSQGPLVDTGLADLTVVLSHVEDLCNVRGEQIELSARVCNRGTNPVSDGARVVFFEGDPDDPETGIACETRLPRFLEVAECTEVSCDWSIPPEGEAVAERIIVVVDPDDVVTECRDENNRGIEPVRVCDLI